MYNNIWQPMYEYRMYSVRESSRVLTIIVRDAGADAAATLAHPSSEYTFPVR